MQRLYVAQMAVPQQTINENKEFIVLRIKGFT